MTNFEACQMPGAQVDDYVLREARSDVHWELRYGSSRLAPDAHGT